MVHILLLALLSAGFVAAIETSRPSLIASRERMDIQNAYPTFPSNPTYVVYKQFSDTSCTQPYQVISFLENNCLAGAATSAVFSCVNGAITKTAYIGSTCSGTPIPVVYTSGAQQCTPHGEASFQTVACGVSAFDFGPGDYAVSVYNQDSTCSKPLVATGNLNNYCYEGHPSMKFAYPYILEFNTTDCSGFALAKAANENACTFTTGQDDDDDDFAKDNSYHSIFHYVNTGADTDDNHSCGGNDDSQDCLSDGAIAGIAVGSAVGAVLLTTGLMWVFKVGAFAGKAPLTAQQEMQGRV